VGGKFPSSTSLPSQSYKKSCTTTGLLLPGTSVRPYGRCGDVNCDRKQSSMGAHILTSERRGGGETTTCRHRVPAPVDEHTVRRHRRRVASIVRPKRLQQLAKLRHLARRDAARVDIVVVPRVGCPQAWRALVSVDTPARPGKASERGGGGGAVGGRELQHGVLEDPWRHQPGWSAPCGWSPPRRRRVPSRGQAQSSPT
jgi:hypothetical protein